MNYKEAFDFDGKIVVVTGAGGSIGREICSAFAKCGANVVVADLNLQRAEETLSALPDVPGGHSVVFVDVTSVDSVDEMVKTVVNKYGRIDFLSNHAGNIIRKPVVDITEEEWNTVIDVNLKGVFNVAQAVGRVMLKQQFGRIVNTASVASMRGHKNLSSYCAAKSGVEQLTKVLAHEWATEGITVNAISPGYVITNQTAEMLANPEKAKELLAKIPVGRFGKEADIAGPILFLCSPLASYITGHNLAIEGGRLID